MAVPCNVWLKREFRLFRAGQFLAKRRIIKGDGLMTVQFLAKRRIIKGDGLRAGQFLADHRLKKDNGIGAGSRR